MAGDPKPAEEIRFLRASVASQCNMSCVYCPKASGMENQVPDRYRGQRLSTAEYCANLDRLVASGLVQGVSFTGGEPTLNPDLPEIVAHARQRYARVELTSNGRFLIEQLDRLAPNLDVLKVSLDTTDSELSHAITRGSRDDHARTRAAIAAAAARGVTVGINFVAMKRNLRELADVVEFARALRHEAPGTVYVSVLDLYYSDEQRQLWLDEFVSLTPVMRHLREHFGLGEAQDRGGCEIEWFDCDGVQVRFKSSYESTYRADRCTRCPKYCQEGFYGLKHSVEGWVTPCPTGDEAYGVLLGPGLSDAEAQERLRPFVAEFATAHRADDTFVEFLGRRGLEPPAVVEDTPLIAGARRAAD